ncbi:MAG: SUMF1/EgtB/PvdO family nonheme iron enzyme [Thermoguttaceae bacterium]|nr:SUMF1/EgtB/PvdO family nonheme iron enzyme [Thermoguttaceae bacterium]
MGEKFALVVGNNTYPDPYRELAKAVEDASEVAGFLKRRLGFETTILYNKTAAEVTKKLRKLVEKLKDDSQFFFYFAGHGLVVGNAESQSLLCTDADELLLHNVQGAPGAIGPEVLPTISRLGRGDMFFCLDVCRAQTLRQTEGPEIQRGGAGLRNAVSRPQDPGSGRPARIFGRRLTLSSCADGQGANDDGLFATALVDEMERLYEGGYEVRLDQNLVDAVQKRLRLGQIPALSGTPFVLVPGTRRPSEPRSSVVGTKPARPESQSQPPQRQQSAQELTGSANAALQAENYVEAERLSLEALERDASFGLAIWVRGEARRRREEQEARESRRRELDHILNEGWLSLARGDATKALQQAESVLEERPMDAAACELKRQAEASIGSSVASPWSDSLSRKAGTRQTLKVGSAEYGFCWIPAGKFKMGSRTTEKDRDDDETLHDVELTKGFWMLESPVPQSLYEEVIGSNPSNFKGGNLPVENVSWDEAMEFCAELTKRLPSGLTASLPTEAQWEYACRAGTKTAFSFGNVLNGDQANCDGRRPYGTTRKGKYLEKTSPVKSYSANAWGLYDMHGNVWEWVLDYYGAYPAGTAIDPKGPDSASYRGFRGGGWDNDARLCRSADRGWYSSLYRHYNLGFRFLLSCD